MAVRGPRGRLRHRRGRGALTSRGTPPPDLRAAPHRQTSVRHPTARPPCGARPARPLAVRAASFARRVVSKPGQAQQASRRPPVGRLVLPGPAATHRHRSHLHPIRPRAALQSGGSYYLALPPPTGTAATSTPAGLAPPYSRAAMTTGAAAAPPIPQPHQPRRQIPHRIRTTPSGLDNSRTNKPSTTCAQPQDLTEARQRGNVETNNTTARPQQRTGETGVTSAPGKCTKNTHFSPAKAMAVATPHRHTRAKATVVSDNRAASLTGTGSATHSH